MSAECRFSFNRQILYDYFMFMFTYVERKSGVTILPPELTKCLKMLKAGDMLMVWKLDRLRPVAA